MPIRKKPTSAKKETPQSVDDFIGEGGSDGKKKTASQQQGHKKFVLRVPAQLLSQVDDIRAERLSAPSRNQWILQAIEEKVLRESQSK